jgi:hypothetical protein
MMNKISLQIDETQINETFASTNNIFDEFRELSSSLFLQVFDWISSITENLIK